VILRDFDIFSVAVVTGGQQNVSQDGQFALSGDITPYENRSEESGGVRLDSGLTNIVY
jgi:hypothetical protein